MRINYRPTGRLPQTRVHLLAARRIQVFDNRDLAGTGSTRLIVEPARFHEFGNARNRTGNCVDVRDIISDIRPASRYLLEFMSSPDVTGPPSPARWGLAAKLFTTLVLLGAIAVLVTGVLGYFGARDALEKAVCRPSDQNAPD
jgi:hypothetical protein